MKSYLAVICSLMLIFAASCSDNQSSRVGKTDNVDSANVKETPLQPVPQVLPQPVEGKSETLLVANEAETAAAGPAPMKTRMFSDKAGAMLRVMPSGDSYGLPFTPGAFNRESYNAIEENRFINSRNDPLSTFSIDVDTASYANVRRFINQGTLPPVGAVRAEEMINYFSYDYKAPSDNTPVAIATEVGPSPFHKDYQLVKIGIKARDIEKAKLPASNLVFLIDVSGSMNHPNKLPLLKQSLKMLTGQLTGADRVSIVVYAGNDRVVLMPTAGDDRNTIIKAIDNLQSGGSTHASQGIMTAYKLAQMAFLPNGNNRVILASDGDFNVGITSREELQKLVETKREEGVFLTVLGFGDGNYHDDSMEILADKGNGNYAYIDSLLEAKKVLIKEMSGTLFTLAKDVKIQVEFNPPLVGAYRLVGYENRALADEDFRDDRKDAGEIGCGHTVTAIYELIPAGHKDIPMIDQLKYQQLPQTAAGSHQELLTVKVRFKPKNGSVSQEISTTAFTSNRKLAETSPDFRFAASVAGYAMLLRDSDQSGTFSWQDCLELARSSKGSDREGYRTEFIRIVEMTQLLKEST